MTDTRELIIREFMKEYAEREDGAVTVKGLCASVPVARTTFYSYFGNTDDILQAVEDELISSLASIADHVSGGNLPDMDFQVFMDAVEEYIRRHWSDIHALFVDRPDQHFIRRWKEAVMFRHGAKAEDAAEDGIRAMLKGKTVRYQGMFAKSASLMSRMMPRIISRKSAGKMNG